MATYAEEGDEDTQVLIPEEESTSKATRGSARVLVSEEEEDADYSSDGSDADDDFPPSVSWKERIRSFPAAAWTWMKNNKIRTCFLLLVLGFVIFGVFEIFHGAVSNALISVLNAVHKIGAWGPVALVGLYLVGVPVLMPVLIVNMGCGLLFRFWIGYLTAMIGVNGGAAIAFLISRRFLSAKVQEKVKGYRTFMIINASLASHNDKWNALKMVLLARLPPLFPYPLFNYAFGLTKVKFSIYLLGTFIGLTPIVAMDVFLGSLFSDITQVTTKQPTWWIAVSVGVTIISTILIGYEVKRTLNKVQKRLIEEKQQRRALRLHRRRPQQQQEQEQQQQEQPRPVPDFSVNSDAKANNDIVSFHHDISEARL